LNIYLTFMSIVYALRKNLIMKSAILSVVTYLLHDDVTGWTDYVNKHYVAVKQNLEVLAIVLIMKKRFLQADEFSAALRFLSDIC